MKVKKKRWKAFDLFIRNADHTVFEQDWDWEEYLDG
jgi:hypothetical protein